MAAGTLFLGCCSRPWINRIERAADDCRRSRWCAASVLGGDRVSAGLDSSTRLRATFGDMYGCKTFCQAAIVILPFGSVLAGRAERAAAPVGKLVADVSEDDNAFPG